MATETELKPCPTCGCDGTIEGKFRVDQAPNSEPKWTKEVPSEQAGYYWIRLIGGPANGVIGWITRNRIHYTDGKTETTVTGEKYEFLGPITPDAPNSEAAEPEPCLIKHGSHYCKKPKGHKEEIHLTCCSDEEFSAPAPNSEVEKLREALEVSRDLLNDVYNSRASQRFSTIGLSRIQSHIAQIDKLLATEEEKE